MAADPTTSTGEWEVKSETEDMVRRLPRRLTFEPVLQLDGPVLVVCVLPGWGQLAELSQRVYDEEAQQELYPERWPS